MFIISHLKQNNSVCVYIANNISQEIFKYALKNILIFSCIWLVL